MLAGKFSLTKGTTLTRNFNLVTPELYAVITSTLLQHAERCVPKCLPSIILYGYKE